LISVNEHREFIAPGLYDDVFILFVDAMCYFETSGVAGFMESQSLNFDLNVNKFVLTCFNLMISGSDDFYFDFVINLEYQRMLDVVHDDKIKTELYLVKSLAYLLRARNREDVYYLVQRCCGVDVSQSLLFKMINVFTEKNIFTRGL